METKKTFLLFIGVLLLSSCQKNLLENNIAHEQLSNNIGVFSITDSNDPNLDPNWDFSDPSTTTAKIYFGQRINGQPVNSTETLLPWFTAGNPINNEDNDYTANLGWVLYLKDFGTPERPAQTPFFALYNIYSGVIRFFVYNYRVRNLNEASKTYYVGELGFNNTSNYNASLSFYAPVDQFTKDRVNPNNKQIVMTKKNASDSWINFDFTMVHDVDPKELRLNVYGTNESEINLGTDFSTLTARSSIGASSTNTSGFAQAMQKGYEYASSTQSFLDAITNLQNKIGTTGSNTATNSITYNNSFPINQNIPSLSSPNDQPEFKAASGVVAIVSAAVGVVKGVIGIVKSFSGGKKSGTATQTTIQYSGIVNTTGTANISNNLYSIQFHQNSQAPLIANRYTPLYSGKTGILGAPDQLYLKAWDFWYPECNSQHHKKELYFFNFNSKFIYDQLISGIYDNNNLNQKISVQTYQAYLVNNTIAEKGYQTVSDAPDYNTYRKYNLFKFLEYTPESINNGVGFNTVHTTPKGLFHTLDNDEVRIEFGSYYFGYGAGDWSKTWFIKNENFNYPKIAIEIHYKITDPNYPLEDSRERVIYKVIEPILDYKQFYTSPRTGCPVM